MQLPTNFFSPTQACGAITAALTTAENSSIPNIQIVTHRKSALWWTPDCTTAKRAKNKALTCYRHHRRNISLWISYKRAAAVYKQTLRSAQRASWNNFVGSLTADTPSCLVWKRLNRLRNYTPPRRMVLCDGSTTLTSPSDVTHALGRHFTTQKAATDQLFTKNKQNAEKCPVKFSPYTNSWYNQPFTLDELNCTLRNCKSSSPGPDGIPYVIIQHIPKLQLPLLLEFYNNVFKKGYPHQWREAIIIPLPKPGKPLTSPESHRPIALTDCIGKVLEKMVTRRLQHYLKFHSVYSPIQSGFRTSHSTLDNLCRLENSAPSAILTSKYCVAVFLDITSAFDSVWHHGLLIKLKKAGIDGELATYIRDFLQLRRIRVRAMN